MKYQITIISLFLVFGLIQKVNSQTESSWLENYEITQLASPEKDILVLSIKNSGKSKKDCLRKAKEQALFHILFKGILRNEISLGSNVLPRKPIPFLEKFDQTDEKNGLYRFICKTGLGNIVDAEKDENIDVVKNEDKSKTFVSVIKLNARSTVTQLEELDLKRTFIEELGFKPKILFIPGDLDQIESYLSNTETNPLVAEYNNQYNLINASFGKSFDLINIFSLREKLETELSINHEKSAEFKEREIDIISRVYVSNVILLLKHLRDKQTGFQATVDPILLSFISVGNSTLNSIGGASKKTDLELIQTILSSETESIIEDIFFNLIDQKGKTNVVKVEISCNSRLKKRIDEKIIYAENNLTFFEIIQDFISSRGLKLTSNGKSNNQCTISFENFMSPFLAQQEKFVEELTTLVEQKTGLALDIDWIGNSLVRFELTDMKRLERQRKINSDYQKAISQKSLELHLQFLKEFPDVEYFSEMKDRYNALITDKVKNKLKDEEYKALLNEEFCTTSRNDVIVSYIQAQIPDNWESIISLDELKNVIQKVKQVSKENNREFSNSENYRNLTNRYNTIISEKIKIKLSNEEFEALLKDEFCTTSRNDVIVSYIQAQIPDNWESIVSLDELKNVIQKVKQVSKENNREFSNSENYRNLTNRYNTIISEKIKIKLSNEEFEALLKDEFCTTSRNDVIVSYIQAQIPENWVVITAMDELKKVIQSINQISQDYNYDYSNSQKYLSLSNRYNELITEKIKAKLSREEYSVLLKDDFCTSSRKAVETSFVESLIPVSWREINTLKGINELIRDIESACEVNNLTTTLTTDYHYSVSDFSEAGKWTFENLKTSHFANGDTIYEAKSNEDWIRANNEKRPAWCYYNNEEAYQWDGKLYNFYAINDPRGLSMDEYAVPALNDYQKLINFFQGYSIAGSKMKAVYLWGEEIEDQYLGFAASPAGIRNENGEFVGNSERDKSGFWTSTDNGESSSGILLYKNNSSVEINGNIPKGYGLSVRLIQKSKNQLNKISNDLFEQIKLKRNQLLLKEFQNQKFDADFNKFFYNQILQEINSPKLLFDELDYINIHNIHNRIFHNSNLIKNGVYPSFTPYIPRPFYGADGGGEDPFGIIKVGYTNNVENYQEFIDGAIYKGSIAEGSFNGEGTFILGEDAQNRGYGKIELQKGDRFEGTFINDEFIQGKITFKNSNVYVGDCKSYQPHGQGKLTLANGQVQQGKFVEGEFIKPFSCKESKIGNQTWMAENLKVTKFRNGEEIMQAQSEYDWLRAAENLQPAWCYYFDESNVDSYGILYNWFAVNDPRGLAPEGWHVPSIYEWQQMINYIEPNSGGGEDLMNTVGLKLKSPIKWKKGTFINVGQNKYGFNVLPGGMRTAFLTANDYSSQNNSRFMEMNEKAYFWSSTPNGRHSGGLDNSYVIDFSTSDFISVGDEFIEYGLSVRCVKD
jgi:uncharacterized protein (TIGR02145 family)